MGLIQKIFGTYSQRELKSIYPIADKIEALEDEYRQLTDETGAQVEKRGIYVGRFLEDTVFTRLR